MAQKAAPPMGAGMLPVKVASEESMGSMSTTPTLQDMLKSAMAGATARAQLANEAAHQQALFGEKIAGEKCSTCGKEPCECKKEKTSASNTVSTEYAEKLAAAIEFSLPIVKRAAAVGPGEGPGALTVTESKSGKPFPDNTGQAQHQPPMHPGTQKAHSQEQGATQMENDKDRAPGGSGTMIQRNVGKIASVLSKLAKEDEKLEKKETEGMVEAEKGLAKAEKAHAEEGKEEKKASSGTSLVDYMLGLTKKAEDAINPAQISAGSAVAPETSAAGESGGAPVGGMPQGPRSLVHSNESAMNYNKNEAKSPVKSDMKKYVDEPALSGSSDSVLRDAFEHASAKDNNKMASAEGVTKVAAARALLAKLAEAAQDKVSKS